MRRYRLLASAAVVVGILLAFVVVRPAIERDTSISTILQNPDSFDGQTVTLRGTVTNLRETVSRRGNPYYTYDLRQGDQTIRVFSFGKAPCSKEEAATVEGRFTKIKRVSGRTFYNEIEARTTRCR